MDGCASVPAPSCKGAGGADGIPQGPHAWRANRAHVSLRPSEPPPERERYRTYRLLRRLGQGAMGAVYLAEDETLQGQVALKVAHGGARHDELLMKLRHEADVLGRLDNDAVVRLLDFFEEDGDAVIVMEHVTGSDILAWSRGRSAREVLSGMVRACEAVASVHDVEFVHLDLKPTNIMMAQDGVKILDFGTAWRLGGDPLTVPMGTPAYMAVEHARLKIDKTGGVDARADVYALGVTLYALCTGGALPFMGPDEALLPMVMTFPPTDPRVYNPTLPDALADLVIDLLAKPASARPPDARALRDVFLSLAATLPDQRLVPETAAPVDVYEPPSPRRVADLLEGRFHVLRKAGSGAFASVYEALETGTGQRWALKVMNTGAPGTIEHRRFAREAKVLERLRHPNVAGYGTHFVVDDVGFLTMEYVEGCDLSRYRGIDVREACWLGVQLSRGLQAAHEADVIHRDLKPANVRVTPDGIVKIVDFGLSRLMDARSALTMTGYDLAGTLGYCAPEAINTSPSPRFDLFSVGVMMYELLSGHMPYPQGMEYINQYLRGEEPQAIPLSRSIPAELRKIVDGLIQFEPALRNPETAGELERELTDLLSAWGMPLGTEQAPSLESAELGRAVSQRLESLGSGELVGKPYLYLESGEKPVVGGARAARESGEHAPPPLDSGAGMPARHPLLDSGETTTDSRPPLDSGEALAAPRQPLDSGEGVAARGLVLDSGEQPNAGHNAARAGLVRFFGRTDAVDQLLDIVHAGGARGRAVVISGPAGIGRTRLLKSVGRLAEATGHVRWIPVAVPAARGSGLGSAAQLERLIARAARAGPGESLETIVRGLAERATVVIALDDAQHLDDTATERLHRLSVAVGEAPLIMLASFRTDAGIDARGAATFAQRFAAHPLEMRGLDLEAMKRLARDRVGLPIDPDFAAGLHETTGGNPGHFLAVLSRSALQVTGNLEATRPGPLLRHAREMLDGIEPAERRAAHLLTLIATPFDSDQARAALGGGMKASGERSDALHRLLAEMVERGILTRDDARDTWSFPSVVMREAASRASRSAADEGDVTLARCGIAAWLEAHERETEAAGQYDRAGRTDDAIRCLERAGAREDLPVAVRIAALEGLAAGLEVDASSSRARLARALIDRGALVRAQSPVDGMALLQRGFALAELSRDAVTRALARCELAKGVQHGDGELAHALVDEAIALLPTPETDGELWHRAYALLIRGHLLIRQAQRGDDQSARVRGEAENDWCEAEQHLSAMRDRHDTKVRSMLAATRGTQLYRERALDAAREQFALSAALAEEGGHVQMMAAASSNLFMLMSQGVGPAEDAHPLFRRARTQIDKVHDDSAQANLHRNYAVTLVERTSDWKDVAALYETALGLSLKLARPSEARIDLLNLSEVKLLQGACDEVAPLLDELARIEPNLPHIEAAHLLPFRQGWWHLARADANPAQACESLGEALALSDATGHHVERENLEATYALALSRLRGGLDAEGTAQLQSAMARAGDVHTPLRARVHRLWGECLLEPSLPPQGDARRAEAVSHFEESLRLALEARYAIEEAFARSYLGRLLEGEGALEHLRRARELKARLGAISLPGERLPPA